MHCLTADALPTLCVLLAPALSCTPDSCLTSCTRAPPYIPSHSPVPTLHPLLTAHNPSHAQYYLQPIPLLYPLELVSYHPGLPLTSLLGPSSLNSHHLTLLHTPGYYREGNTGNFHP